jgi:hypothetical protein
MQASDSECDEVPCETSDSDAEAIRRLSPSQLRRQQLEQSGAATAASRLPVRREPQRHARKLSPARTVAVEPARHDGIPSPVPPRPLAEPARHSTAAHDAAAARQKWRIRAMSPATPADLDALSSSGSAPWSDAISPVDEPGMRRSHTGSGAKVVGKRVPRSMVPGTEGNMDKPWRQGSARASLNF